MASSVSHNSFSTIPLFVGFLVVASSLAHVLSSPLMSDSGSGEPCPEGNVPIRRTTKKDVLRASSVRRYRRTRRRHVRRDSTGSGHEHAVVFVNGDQYYGAKASLNVRTPHVTNEYEFSLSQIWIISGSFSNDLNTIEAGWFALNYMEIITLDSSHTGQLTHTEPLDATTCCVRALSKPPIRLLLEQQSLQSPPTMADSLTST
ncbi:hypothetical protein J1N35_020331 [Gossypium stocksii]|uniref:Neprosin PEP catalytic domain-containing protein n=1 Tax=Gossypium stocksii TaxID=47602 RepID=A0A9D3VC84_9ROSI|nr:hypothetical protein J1N35_020331 [Gossypium stocksii]